MKRRKIKANTYGQFPSWVVFSGWLTHLTPSEIAVFCVLVCHQDNETHRTWATLDTIAAEAGITRSSIPKITKRLVEKVGIICKRRRGNRVEYEIVMSGMQHMLDRPSYWHPRMRKVRAVFKDTNTGRFTKGGKQPEYLDSSLYPSLDSKQIPTLTEPYVPKITEHPIPKARCAV